MSSSSIIAGFINNAALLLAVGLLYDVLFLRDPDQKIINKIIIGIILGALGIGLMLNPWEFRPGIIFDVRTVLLSITGFFFGIVPTSIAVFIAKATSSKSG